MTKCDRCGEDLTDEDKDNRGWFRDHCRDCISDLAWDINTSERREPAQWLNETPTPEGFHDG